MGRQPRRVRSALTRTRIGNSPRAERPGELRAPMDEATTADGVRRCYANPHGRRVRDGMPRSTSSISTTSSRSTTAVAMLRHWLQRRAGCVRADTAPQHRPAAGPGRRPDVPEQAAAQERLIGAGKLVTAVWCLVFGVWRLAFGVWCLAFGGWRMASAAWQVPPGAWRACTLRPQLCSRRANASSFPSRLIQRNANRSAGCYGLAHRTHSRSRTWA